jgi:hypothetical protein
MADGLDAPTRSTSFSGHYLRMGSRDMTLITDGYSGPPYELDNAALNAQLRILGGTSLGETVTRQEL